MKKIQIFTYFAYIDIRIDFIFEPGTKEEISLKLKGQVNKAGRTYLNTEIQRRK